MSEYRRRTSQWTGPLARVRSPRPVTAAFGGLANAKALLDVPAGLDVLAILPFGYPARPVGRGKKQRKPLREVAHLERYGRPSE